MYMYACAHGGAWVSLRRGCHQYQCRLEVIETSVARKDQRNAVQLRLLQILDNSEPCC